MSPRTQRAQVPAMLEAVIVALEQQEFHNAMHAAKALRAFGEMAALEVPGRGVFAADRPELYQAIENIADAHLGFSRPRRAFSKATGMVSDADLRERIQASANEMQSISDQAYFYAGLAFGVTLSRFGCPC
jgi:hypothetical protein